MTIDALCDLDPQVKAIVSSGHANDPIMAPFRHYGLKGAVAKPRDIHALNQVLSQAIDGN